MSFEVEGKIIALYKLGFIYLTLKIYCVKTLVLVIISNRKWFILLSPCLSALDFRIMDFGVYFKLGKKSSSQPTWFFFNFEIRIFFPSYWARVGFFHEFPCLITLFVYFGLTFVNTLTQKNGFQKSSSESNLIFWWENPILEINFTGYWDEFNNAC